MDTEHIIAEDINAEKIAMMKHLTKELQKMNENSMMLNSKINGIYLREFCVTYVNHIKNYDQRHLDQ